MNKLIVSLLLTLGITGVAHAAGDATAGQAKAAVCGAGCPSLPSAKGGRWCYGHATALSISFIIVSRRQPGASAVSRGTRRTSSVFGGLAHPSLGGGTRGAVGGGGADAQPAIMPNAANARSARIEMRTLRS